MTIDIPVALKSLRPNAEWHMVGTEYSGIYWDDKIETKPTEQEVEERIAVLKYQEEVNAYQEKRKLEYPDWGDQLDQIYHSGIDAWKTDIKVIKDKYPKQTMDTNELLKRKKAAAFNLQKRNYERAVARLAQYELANGVKGVVGTQKIWKDTNGAGVYVDEDVIGYIIEPLPIEVDGKRNPLVVQDEAERAAAQEVINNTPQAVIDSVSS
tara:strand:+ start:685 stop:1314 length:630 start_codon:yes stop_codon:yes gene_type:complete